MFGLYAGCTPSKVGDVVRLMDEQWQMVVADGITEAELRRAKGQLSGSLVLGLEDPGSRMSRLGRSELVLGELWSLEDTLTALREVTVADVQALAADLASNPRSLVMVGPFEQDMAGETLASL